MPIIPFLQFFMIKKSTKENIFVNKKVHNQSFCISIQKGLFISNQFIV